jgi:hypothetical protein
VGRARSRKIIFFLASINLIATFWLWHFNSMAALIFWLMNAALLCILVFEEAFKQHNYYRIAGDAVFILPLFYLL